MAVSEEIIYEIQNILKSKPELLHYPVLKKAMEIEEYLYTDALVRTRLDRNDGHVWQSKDSVREYQISADKLIQRLREREGDWVKLFNTADIRLFIYRVYQDYVPTKVSRLYWYYMNIPAYHNMTNINRNQRKKRPLLFPEQKRSNLRRKQLGRKRKSLFRYEISFI